MRFDHEFVGGHSVQEVRAAEESRLRAQQRLGVRDPAALAQAILLSLAWQFQADVSVAVDQWFGVCARRGEDVDCVECDHPLDGIVALWHALADRVPGALGTVPPVDNAAERALAEEQMAELERRHQAHEAHAARCPGCQSGKSYSCAEAASLIDHAWKIRRSQFGKWGTPDPETSPRFYGFEPEDEAAG